MHLKEKTLKKVNNLAKEDKYTWFFENLEKENLNKDQLEILEKLSDIASEELEIYDEEKINKIKFFIKLGKSL